MSNRSIDDIFVKNLRASHVETSSQAAATGVDLGALNPNAEPMCERDVTAVAGTTPVLNGTIEGSNDGTTWADAAQSAMPAISTVSRQVISLKKFRRYRSGATTITGTSPSFTFSDKIVGIASERPVTQP
jgi:hypothetical protein